MGGHVFTPQTNGIKCRTCNRLADDPIALHVAEGPDPRIPRSPGEQARMEIALARGADGTTLTIMTSLPPDAPTAYFLIRAVTLACDRKYQLQAAAPGPSPLAI